MKQLLPLTPRAQGIMALALGGLFVALMCTNPDVRGRYADAFFALIGLAIGGQRLGGLPGKR